MASYEKESYSRIFILGAKEKSEESLRDEFDKYGIVKDIYFVKDRVTNERKDVAYVTFSKASEAALAIEEMNGKLLDDCSRPLKVILANNRNEGSVREANEDTRMLRLFIMVPRGYTEKELQDDFSKYGEVENIRFVRDRQTGADRNLAYVKFTRAYHAALALEKCDARYRPVFATNSSSRPPPSARDDDRRRDVDTYRRGPDYRNVARDRLDRFLSPYEAASLLPPMSRAPPPAALEPRDILDMVRSYPNQGQRVLEALMPTASTYDQTVKLFDIIPGLENFTYDQGTGVVHAKYNTPSLASYAKDKLDGLEYPPGYRVNVAYYKGADSRYESFAAATDVSNTIGNSILAMNRGMLMTAHDPNGPGAVKSLVDTIQKAMLLLQQTGLTPSATADMAWGLGGQSSSTAGVGQMGYGTSSSSASYGDRDSDQPRYCSVQLPSRQPMAPKDSKVVERLFIVSVPEAFPVSFLEDCFCRFGNLITAFFMPGRNCGYVKYASAESARHAVAVLHMKTICGNTLKVMVADEPPPVVKRRYDDRSRSRSPDDMKHSRMS